MFLFLCFFAYVLALGSGALYFRLKHFPTSGFSKFAFRYSFFILFIMALVLVLGKYADQMLDVFSGGRLLAPLLLTQNPEIIYPEIGKDPLIENIYTPVGYLLYAPVCYFFSHPVTLVLSGLFVSGILIFGFVGGLISQVLKKLKFLTFVNWLMVFTLFALFACFFVLAAFKIYVEAVAILLLLASYYFLNVFLDSRRPELKISFFISLLLLVLASLSKQYYGAFICGFGLIIFLRGSARLAMIYAGLFFLIFILGIGVLGFFFDLSKIWQYAVEIPSQHPWRYGDLQTALLPTFLEKLTIYGRFAYGSFVYFSVFLCGIAALALFLLKKVKLQDFLIADGTSFFILSLNIWPCALLSVSKEGGGKWGLSIVAVLLFLSLFAYFVLWVSISKKSWNFSKIFTFSAVVLLFFQLSLLGRVSRAIQHFPNFWNNPYNWVYDFSLKYPDKYYFPHDTLAVYLATGNLYHFEHALIDCVEYTDYSLLESEISCNLPNTNIFAYHKDSFFHYFLEKIYPNHTRMPDDPELPGFEIYRVERPGHRD